MKEQNKITYSEAAEYLKDYFFSGIEPMLSSERLSEALRVVGCENAGILFKDTLKAITRDQAINVQIPIALIDNKYAGLNRQDAKKLLNDLKDSGLDENHLAVSLVKQFVEAFD